MSRTPDLAVDGITVRFGGLTAVNDLTLAGQAGTITGLIGPNGAGKTTTFNACTGNVIASTGQIRLGGERLDERSTANRGARGLGRTFQRMELFDSMTVRENVSLGPEAFFFSSRRWGHVLAPRSETREIADRAARALDRCGITELANLTAGALSTGQRRLVELARALATPFRFLLLDEPSSGLDVKETEEFGEILHTFVQETGVGVLLVEHDMALVAKVCTFVYVMDFGRLIHSGPTAEVLRSPIVKAAYLGTDATDDGDFSNQLEDVINA